MESVLKLINVTAFQKQYLPMMSAYKLRAGNFTAEEKAIIADAVNKFKDDLLAYVAQSTVIGKPKQSTAELTLFDFENESKPTALPAPKPEEPHPARSMKNIEPYKYAERKPSRGVVRQSIVSW